MSNLPLKIRAKLALVLYVQRGELRLVNRLLKWDRLKDDESLLALRDEIHNDIGEIHFIRLKGEILYAEAHRRGLQI